MLVSFGYQVINSTIIHAYPAVLCTAYNKIWMNINSIQICFVRVTYSKFIALYLLPHTLFIVGPILNILIWKWPEAIVALCTCHMEIEMYSQLISKTLICLLFHMCRWWLLLRNYNCVLHSPIASLVFFWRFIVKCIVYL